MRDSNVKTDSCVTTCRRVRAAAMGLALLPLVALVGVVSAGVLGRASGRRAAASERHAGSLTRFLIAERGERDPLAALVAKDEARGKGFVRRVARES